jgi:TolB-like protein/tetratricopeptide (TPR) repeat protein
VDARALIGELTRRRVIRALAGYGIAAFAVLQIIEPVMHGLHWPDEVLTYVVVALAVGFPIVVGLAWIFDVNAGRIERTAPVRGITGTRLVLVLVGIGLIAAAPGTIWYFAVRGIAKRPAASTPAPPVDAQPSIAVLPFADMSPGKDQEYFSDGIAEEIIDSLARVDGLKVIGRTSSFSFKGKNDDLRAIGEKLGVAHVLEGSVRKAGDRIKITAELINAADGSHLWSQAFDRKLTDVFAVQEEIARAVVDGLKVKLLVDKGQRMNSARTTSPEAYAQFLIGNKLATIGASPAEAAAAYKKALAIDAAFPPAWAGLSKQIATETAWRVDGTKADQPEQARELLSRGLREATEAANKAIELAPNSPDGYAARSLLRRDLAWDWEGARSDVERALALAPGSAEAHRRYAGLLMTQGKLAAAKAEGIKATELDPLEPANWLLLAKVCTYMREFGPARRALERLEKLKPDSEPVYSWALLYVLQGDYDNADKYAEKFVEPLNRDAWRAAIDQARGNTTQAQKLWGEIEARVGAVDPYGAASVSAWLGQRDRSFEWLEEAYAKRQPLINLLKADPELESLHGDPRWTALLKKMNLPLD